MYFTKFKIALLLIQAYKRFYEWLSCFFKEFAKLGSVISLGSFLSYNYFRSYILRKNLPPLQLCTAFHAFYTHFPDFISNHFFSILHSTKFKVNGLITLFQKTNLSNFCWIHAKSVLTRYQKIIHVFCNYYVKISTLFKFVLQFILLTPFKT